MIYENLKELQVFISKETGISNVSIINKKDGDGYRATIDHGSETVEDGKPIFASIPVTVTISDSIENYERVLKNAEILRKEIREKKAHIWNAKNLERVESETEYSIRVNLTIPVLIS